MVMTTMPMMMMLLLNTRKITTIIIIIMYILQVNVSYLLKYGGKCGDGWMDGWKLGPKETESLYLHSSTRSKCRDEGNHDELKMQS